MPRRKYDIVNEQAILTAVLHDREHRRRALACAKSQDFVRPWHRTIFSAVATCEADGIDPAPTDVATRTEGKDFGGLSYVKKLIAADSPVDLEVRLDTLRRDSARAKVKRTAQEVIDAAEDPEVEYGEVVTEAAELLQGLKDAPLRSGKVDTGEDWLDDYNRRRLGEADIFVSTGYNPLDEVMTEGYAPGSVTVVGGRPKMGKTSFMVDGVRRLIRRRDKRILFVAVEKNRKYIINLLVSSVTGIDKRLIIKEPESLTKEQDRKIGRAVEWLFGDGRLRVIDNPVRALLRAGRKYDNQAVVDRMGEVLALYDSDITIWDTWQRMLKNTSPEQVSTALIGTYDLGVVTDTHNILVHHVHRRVEDRSQDKARRPTMSDLKQSGEWEQGTDQILLVHREKVFKPHMPKGDVIEVILAKQKLGEDDVTMVARFRPETCRLAKPRLATAEDMRPGASFLREE